MEPAVKVGEIYAAKKPKLLGIFNPLYDDRQILYVSPHKTVVGYKDHGFTPEYTAWSKTKPFPSSEITQMEFESETGGSAKNIEAIMDYLVQYDSPSVKDGKKYPSIPQTKFLKWAGKNVTDIMPKGEWRKG